jgi:hypothetical protein
MAVRFCMPETVIVAISNSYLNLVTDAPLETTSVDILAAPEISFAEIKISEEKAVVIAKKLPVQRPAAHPVIAKNELPFHEPIILEKIIVTKELPTNLVALYKDFAFEETLVAKSKVVTDEVSTTLASSESAEPEFFEYPVEPQVKAKHVVANETEKSIEVKATTETIANDENLEVQEVSDLMEGKKAEVVASASVEPEFHDYPEKVDSQPLKVSESIDTSAKEVVGADLVAFDYSKAKQDIATQTIPKVVRASSHKAPPKAAQVNRSIFPDQTPKQIEVTEEEVVVVDENEKSSLVPHSYPVSVSILALGSNLKHLEKIQGFEVRFQDDLSETIEDYGSGEVKYETELSQPKMTRTATLLKRGYIPVTTEIILEEGVGSVTIPLIEEETFNELMLPFERRGAVGALLVELDDETDVAKIDVPFGEVVKLNGDLERTENEDFRYQLFLGVQAGNAMVSYHGNNGEVVTKIVHIHENEVTHDANFYEDVINEKVRLYEEDLLAKEMSPLIISGEQVKIFATNSHAKKINNHTYKMAFGSSNLGGRRYLELSHQSEPVFVGMRENTNISVPSENFMRFILSKVEGAKLGNRCLVQINLTKKAMAFEVASESISQSLMTSTQMLDSDGKFYDSLSDKTRKIIVVGEGQGAQNISPDAKLNIKIQYQDGTVQFLNSYCSPNTYLVEQL